MMNHADFRTISKAMRDDRRPVFIVGEARSGTSILYRGLQGHSDFQCPHSDSNINLTESFCFLNPPLLLSDPPVDRGKASFEYMLQSDDHRQRFLQTVQPLSKRQTRARKKLHAIARRAHVGRATAWKLLGYHHLLRNYFHFAVNARGAKRILEKTPSHITRLPEIWATFPNALCIYICRHPLTTYASFFKRYQRELDNGADPASLQWLRPKPAAFAKTLNYHFDTALKAQANRADQFRIIQYEQLTQQPHELIQDICQFVGVDFEDDLLDKLSSSGASNNGWSADPKLHGGIQAAATDWQDTVPEEDAVLITQTLSPLMSRMGYEPGLS